MKKLSREKQLKTGQSTVEYFLIMVVILVAVLSTGFIGRIRGAFRTYFDNAVTYLR